MIANVTLYDCNRRTSKSSTSHVKPKNDSMITYILTLICAACILIAAFFAIRYRKVNSYIRLAAIALATLFVLFLYFKYDDTSQLYGLGILAIALVFPLIDIKRNAKE